MQTIRAFIELPERAFDGVFSCYFSVIYMVSARTITISPWC
jgi:hypothetical protein